MDARPTGPAGRSLRRGWRSASHVAARRTPRDGQARSGAVKSPAPRGAPPACRSALPPRTRPSSESPTPTPPALGRWETGLPSRSPALHPAARLGGLLILFGLLLLLLRLLPVLLGPFGVALLLLVALVLCLLRRFRRGGVVLRGTGDTRHRQAPGDQDVQELLHAGIGLAGHRTLRHGQCPPGLSRRRGRRQSHPGRNPRARSTGRRAGRT